MFQVRQGLETFRQEVEDGIFPQEEHSPYKMSSEEEKSFHRLLAKVSCYKKKLRPVGLTGLGLLSEKKICKAEHNSVAFQTFFCDQP